MGIERSRGSGDFFAKGWRRFAYDETLARWVAQALPAARAAVAAPENAQWRRSAGTWFVGVNALPNDAAGALPGGTPLAGRAVDFIRNDLRLGAFDWDSAQVSVVYPGYPQQTESESEGAFRFRRERDAAHVDGVLHEGPRKRRYLCQFHRFILGIPMVESAGASPLVVWEGSHELVRRALLERLGAMPAARWQDEDITELYRSVRREIFETCERVELVAQPGEAYLLHRLVLHGIAPWPESAPAGADGRMIAYFRPEAEEPTQAWLTAP